MIPLLRKALALLALALAAPSISVSHSSEVSSASTNKTIVVLGDSLAAGYGLEPEQAFPVLLQKKIDAAGWKVFVVINAGQSGDTTAGGLRRLNWLLRRKIDVMIVELGGNDGLRGISLDETRKNLEAIVRRTKDKYPGVRVALAGMQMPPNLGDEYVRPFKALYPEVAKKTGATLIPFLLENVGGHPELNQADQIHPTAEGQQIVAENVWRVLQPILRELAQ